MPRRPAKVPQKYGLTAEDRTAEIARKLGVANAELAQSFLQRVRAPTEQVLGAIVFLANRVEEFEELVRLANEDRQTLLNAATVKDERG